MSLNQWGLSINWILKSVIIITINNDSTLNILSRLKHFTFRQIILVHLVYLLIGGVFCQWSELWWFKGRKTKALEYLAFLRSCRGCVESRAECCATKRSACFHDNNSKARWRSLLFWDGMVCSNWTVCNPQTVVFMFSFSYLTKSNVWSGTVA